MSKFWLGNIYLLLSLLCASGSQIVLKALFNEIGPLSFGWSFVEQLTSVGIAFRALVAITLLVVGFLFWLMALSRLDLSYAYSIACSSALFVTFFSTIFLGELVSARMWLGTVLIVLGTVLLVPSQS